MRGVFCIGSVHGLGILPHRGAVETVLPEPYMGGVQQGRACHVFGGLDLRALDRA